MHVFGYKPDYILDIPQKVEDYFERQRATCVSYDLEAVCLLAIKCYRMGTFRGSGGGGVLRGCSSFQMCGIKMY